MAATEREIERLIVRLVGDGKQYEQTLRAAGTQTKKYTQDLQGRLRDAQGKFVNMQQRMALGITRTGRALGPVSAAFTRFGARVMAVGNTLGAFLAKVRAGLLKFAIYVVAPAAAIFKLGSDFEAEMSKIVGLVGVARDQVNAWSKDILRLAPQLGKAPKEMAQAMFFVTSAGARGEKAMEVLTRSAKASAAGLGETKTVADAVTSAMNAYARTGMTAARATDILTAAVREGKLEASALAPVMGRVLPMASAMGVRFEDVAGAMAVMSRTGAEANQAATSIQALMMALQKPTAEATELLKSAGLSFGDLRDMVRKPGGVIEALRLLESRFKFNDTALATLIPNVRALRCVMNVLAQDATIVDSVMS